MEIAIQKYTVGQVVFGKLKGYPPWPAVITALPKGRNIASITYFNSGQCSDLSFKKLTPYHAAGNVIHKYANKNKSFTKALQEMELVATKMNKKDEEKKTATKKYRLEPRVIIKLLSKAEISEIQSKLKTSKKKSGTISDGAIKLIVLTEVKITKKTLTHNTYKRWPNSKKKQIV